MLLARVRKSARAVLGPRPLAEIAVNHRYADQAHMSREFKRWLNISPLKTKFEIEVLKQLSQPGYSYDLFGLLLRRLFDEKIKLLVVYIRNRSKF